MKPQWLKVGSLVRHREEWRGLAVARTWGDGAVTVLTENENDYAYWSFENLIEVKS